MAYTGLFYYKIVIPYFGDTIAKYLINPLSSVWNKVFSYVIAQIIAGLAAFAALITFIVIDSKGKFRNQIILSLVSKDNSIVKLLQTQLLTSIYFRWTWKTSIPSWSCNLSIDWLRFLSFSWSRQMENCFMRSLHRIYNGNTCIKMGCKSILDQ